MQVACIWEHNGDDTLLYAADFPGAYTRGENLAMAMAKMPAEIASYLRWAGTTAPCEITWRLCRMLRARRRYVMPTPVLFDGERAPLSMEAYTDLKTLALKSAADFHDLYASIPDKNRSVAPERKTFYGQVPRSAEEMYLHTRNVNDYYFSEIGVDADQEGTIWSCRQRGFAALGSRASLPCLRGKEAMANTGHCEKCCAAFFGMTVSMQRRCIAWGRLYSALKI